MNKLCFISGLGADEKAFSNLPDFGIPKVDVKWIPNEHNESLYNYAQRLISKYRINQGDIIIGLSFGGLLAQQMAEILGSRYVILISSFRTREDLKFLFRQGLRLHLHKLIPELKSDFIGSLVANYLNSGSQISRPIIEEMVKETDMKLMKWSIEKIFELKSELAQDVVKFNLIGSNDRIVKFWHNETTYEISGGSHFMVFEEADAVSRIIQNVILNN